VVALRLFETAHLTARCRALEHRRTAPRYSDSFAEVFADSTVDRRRVDAYVDTIVARARIVDRFLLASMPCDTIVNIGAGFDMRSAKPEFADVGFIEVDDAAVHERKRTLLSQRGVELRVRSVIGCFPDLFGLPIWAVGRTVCVTEGLLTYFPADDVVRFASRLAREETVDHWVTDWVGTDSTRWLNAETDALDGSFRHHQAPPIDAIEACGFEVLDYQPFSSELRSMGSRGRAVPMSGLGAAGDSVIRLRRSSC
jgi:O-methyltransferase involved in polyketide biosynthesis